MFGKEEKFPFCLYCVVGPSLNLSSESHLGLALNESKLLQAHVAENQKLNKMCGVNLHHQSSKLQYEVLSDALMHQNVLLGFPLLPYQHNFLQSLHAQGIHLSPLSV